MNVVAIIQARMSSSRFPGKVLAELHGKPLVLHILDRARQAKRVNQVLLATSSCQSDDILVEQCQQTGVQVYRGDLNDVLGRMFEAAFQVKADVVVRLTADCPWMDPNLINSMVEYFLENKFDYLSNISPPTYPDGLDIEIMTFKTLQKAHVNAVGKHAREHVTPYIRENPALFNIGNWVNPDGDWSGHLWSVDTPEDLERISKLNRAELKPVLQNSRNSGAVKTLLSELENQAPRPKINHSHQLWECAKNLIPAGTQTLSKGPTQFINGFAPKYLVRGFGSHVWDVDGNEYIDYPMALGAVTLGHAYSEVVEAVYQQLRDGNSFTLMHPLEIELAEKIIKLVPCAEQVRFGKNGSDATSACIRAARAKTGKKYVARCGYHGWQDWAIDPSYGIRSRGIPEEIMAMTTAFPYNNLEALEDLLKMQQYAAVILEPMNTILPQEGYLEGVRQLATKYGAVLIFDEIVTGFRYGPGGAQQYFGVTPDLCAMGKGMANGFPISVVAGKREFMSEFETIFFSFTFGGEVSALRAALKTLEIMERENYWAHAFKQGSKLQEGFKTLARDYRLSDKADCVGLAPWTIVNFANLELKTLFQQEMIRHGILFAGSQMISLSHSDEDIDKTLRAYQEAMKVLRFALDSHAVKELTLGEPIELIFRRG